MASMKKWILALQVSMLLVLFIAAHGDGHSSGSLTEDDSMSRFIPIDDYGSSRSLSEEKSSILDVPIAKPEDLYINRVEIDHLGTSPLNLIDFMTDLPAEEVSEISIHASEIIESLTKELTDDAMNLFLASSCQYERGIPLFQLLYYPFTNVFRTGNDETDVEAMICSQSWDLAEDRLQSMYSITVDEPLGLLAYLVESKAPWTLIGHLMIRSTQCRSMAQVMHDVYPQYGSVFAAVFTDLAMGLSVQEYVEYDQNGRPQLQDSNHLWKENQQMIFKKLFYAQLLWHHRVKELSPFPVGFGVFETIPFSVVRPTARRQHVKALVGSEAERRLEQMKYTLPPHHRIQCPCCAKRKQMGNSIYILPCGHYLCSRCAIGRLTRHAVCPQCQAAVDPTLVENERHHYDDHLDPLINDFTMDQLYVLVQPLALLLETSPYRIMMKEDQEHPMNPVDLCRFTLQSERVVVDLLNQVNGDEESIDWNSAKRQLDILVRRHIPDNISIVESE